MRGRKRNRYEDPITEDDMHEIHRLYGEGKSAVEIGRAIGCSERTVYYKLSLIRFGHWKPACTSSE